MKDINGEDQQNKLKDLLRIYQQEIDRLSKSLKVSHNLFIEAYEPIVSSDDLKKAMMTNKDNISEVFDRNNVLPSTDMKIQELNEQILELTERSESVVQELKDQLKAKDVLIADISSRENDFKNILAVKEREIQQLLEKDEGLRSKLENCDLIKQNVDVTTNDENHSTIENLNQELLSAKNEIENLQQELLDSKEQMKILHNKIEENPHLSTTINDLEEKLIIAEKQLVNLKEIEDDFSFKLPLMKAQIGDQEKQIAALNEENSKLLLQVREKNESLESTENQINVLMSNNSQSKTIEELTGKIAFLEENMKSVKSSFDFEKERLQTELIEAQSQPGVQMAQFEKMRIELRILKASQFPEHCPSEAESEVPLEKILHLQNSQLQSELLRATNNLSQVQESFTLISNNFELLKVEKDMLEEKLTQLHDQHVQMSKTVSPVLTDSSSNSNILTAHSPEISFERDALIQRSIQLEEQVEHISRQLVSQRNECSRLHGENTRLFDRIKVLDMGYSGISDSGENGEVGDNLIRGDARGYESINHGNQQSLVMRIAHCFSSVREMDRTVWWLGKVVLTNKLIRRLSIIYTISIHVMIIILIFHKPITASTQIV